MATNTLPRQNSGFADWWTRTTKTRMIYVYLAPAFIVMGIVTFYPLFYQIWMSFTDYGIKNIRFDAPPPNWLGLQNYLDIFSGRLAVLVPNFDFWYLLIFNLVWTFTQVPVHVIMGVLIAVLLNQKGLLFKGVYRALYILPMIFPTLVVAAVWRNMFDPSSGVINQALAQIGGLFGAAPEAFQIRWMEQIAPPIPGIPLTLSFFAVSIVNIWLGWPFMTIVASGALQSIPGDLYEAASIDGASHVQKFFGITVPLLRPAMVPAAMYGIIMTFNQFNMMYFVTQGGPLRKTEIMVTTAFRLVNGNRLYGMAAAFCVLIFFILLALTLLTNRVTRATEAYDV